MMHMPYENALAKIYTRTGTKTHKEQGQQI